MGKPQNKQSARVFWIKLLSLMALVFIATFVVYRLVAQRALNQQAQAVHDAGLPLTLEELDAWHELPKGKNAADVYLRAIAAFPIEPKSDGVPIMDVAYDYILGQPLDPDTVEKVEHYLALHAETITLLEEAAQIEKARFPIDLTQGINVFLPSLGPLRRCARLLKLQSILDADRGDYDLAAKRCITIIALARSQEDEPILIASLVSISIHALAFEQIEMLVTSGHLSDDTLRALTEAIEPIDFENMLYRGMIGERCMGHAIFKTKQDLASLLPFGDANGVTVAALRTLGLLDIDHRSYLDIMQSYIEFAKTPAWPIPATLDRNNQIPRLCIVTRMVTPAYATAYKAVLQSEARRRTSLVGIAAERYRQKHSAFPAQLTDLVPGFINTVPLDPFDGKPLRYRTEDTGVIIYSISADGKDDGGQIIGPDGTKSFQDGNDIPFTFGGLQGKLWPVEEAME